MIYKELDLKIDTDYLLEVFEDHKDTKLSQYKIKNTQGEILGTRDYFEMYFTFKEGKDLFFNNFRLNVEDINTYTCPRNMKWLYTKT